MATAVRQIMAPRPATVPQDATVDDALRLLLSRRVGEVYVTDARDRPVGVVPDYEFLKARLAGVADGATVEGLMSRCFATVEIDWPVEEIVGLFRDARYARIPVVEGGRLVGEVVRRDVLEFVASRGAESQTAPRHGFAPNSCVTPHASHILSASR